MAKAGQVEGLEQDLLALHGRLEDASNAVGPKLGGRLDPLFRRLAIAMQALAELAQAG